MAVVRTVNLRLALLCLVTPHMFFRFLGFSFLVPGVVSASLSKSWTVPTGYGDVVGGILAIVAVIALARVATWAIAAVWIFNVWVTADVPLPHSTDCESVWIHVLWAQGSTS
jgi:hypothetical protein